MHVAKSNLSGKVLPTVIGDNVTVGEEHFCKDKEWCSVPFLMGIYVFTEQVIVLFYTVVLLRTRLLLVWVPYYLME